MLRQIYTFLRKQFSSPCIQYSTTFSKRLQLIDSLQSFLSQDGESSKDGYREKEYWRYSFEMGGRDRLSRAVSGAATATAETRVWRTRYPQPPRRRMRIIITREIKGAGEEMGDPLKPREPGQQPEVQPRRIREERKRSFSLFALLLLLFLFPSRCTRSFPLLSLMHARAILPLPSFSLSFSNRRWSSRFYRTALGARRRREKGETDFYDSSRRKLYIRRLIVITWNGVIISSKMNSIRFHIKIKIKIFER